MDMGLSITGPRCRRQEIVFLSWPNMRCIRCASHEYTSSAIYDDDWAAIAKNEITNPSVHKGLNIEGYWQRTQITRSESVFRQVRPRLTFTAAPVGKLLCRQLPKIRRLPAGRELVSTSSGSSRQPGPAASFCRNSSCDRSQTPCKASMTCLQE